ncbi:chemotaxis protein CheA [Ammoniphilus sp. CFH 90114]|uniref:chemotaxis protein CheA n=1 Tax=Ammoniphilus sp. CFH 90114 TaxID=2493665 RepID=UPI00100DA372|nr:chemotaxis protein CheA [Ammoniphilus sp. CFH 90114]RXT15134.1 chemotaxis protein CheA [Ammoniphilus sp. CFH 90114]
MDMEQYLDMFIEESKEHLQAINENLLRLEDAPGDTSIVNDIFRSAHTLKGMSATMGFEDMANLTHEMENVLDQVRNGKLTVQLGTMDTLFRCVDILESILYSIAQGGDGRHDVTAVVADLRRILSGDTIPGKTPDQSADPELTNIEFDDYEYTVMKQSLDSGYNAYQIETMVREDCVLKAARAYMVFDQLESCGEIIKAVPSVEELEEEKFDKTFQVVLLTKKPKEELEKIVMSVSEIESVLIHSIESIKQPLLEETKPVNAEGDDEIQVIEPKEQQQLEKATVQKKVASGKTIRVDIERLDILMNLFSELVIDRGRLEQLSRDSKNPALIETVEHMSRISGDLQNIILNMRMVPVEQVFNRFPRMVRDLAKDLNKKVNLYIEGAETELDRTVIDEIGDPLVHLLRNSIDHGLESPDERLKVGKEETGKVILKAYHSGNHVFIEVMDDGKGIDRQKILKKAKEKGIIQEHQATSMSDKQVYELLFASGLSTAEKITDVSGRGVGLDVVKTKIESLGGAVSVDSVPGQGTTFLIQLPLTLSIISAMLVEVEREKFAVPLSSIIETAVFRKDQIMRAHQQDVIDFRGRVVPLVSLKKIFHIPDSLDNKRDEISVVIVRKGDKMAGLVVDSFIGQQEIVLKSLGKYLVNVFAISGATILGDGQVALIIDCNTLIK